MNEQIDINQWTDEVAASEADLSTPPVKTTAPGNPVTEGGASEKLSPEIDAADETENV